MSYKQNRSGERGRPIRPISDHERKAIAYHEAAARRPTVEGGTAPGEWTARSAEPERYKIRYSDGTIRTVSDHSYSLAWRAFVIRFQPPAGQCCIIWKQGNPGNQWEANT